MKRTMHYILAISLLLAASPALARGKHKRKRPQRSTYHATRRSHAPKTEAGDIRLLPKDGPNALKPNEVRVHSGTASGKTLQLDGATPASQK